MKMEILHVCVSLQVPQLVCDLNGGGPETSAQKVTARQTGVHRGGERHRAVLPQDGGWARS